MSGILIIDTNEFLGALSRLKPLAPRRRKSNRIGIAKGIAEYDFYISYLFGEVVFSSHGVQTRCVAEKADWRGYVSTDFGVILSFLKIKPTGETVSISFSRNKLKIDTLIVACQSAPVPDWIGSMSAEALFQSERMEVANELMFCPKCGKRQSLNAPHKPNMQLELGDPPQPKVIPTRVCKACKYGWVEIT